MEPDRALALACPTGDVHVGEAVDAVDGVIPSHVVRPGNAGEVAGAIRVAAERDLALVARGAGTKLDWGAPPSRLDLVLDVSAINDVVEHAVGDFVVRVQPGMGLAALNHRLADAGQRLCVDETVKGATIGGTVATAPSGPLRLGFGAVRDLLIGATFARADGVVARTGSKVVKNVAGFDLAKLLTGSYGTLGIVVEAILRLHPLPACTRYVSRVYDGPTSAAAAVDAILESHLGPSALELQRTGGDAVRVVSLLEGSESGTERRALAMRGLLGGADIDEAAPSWWAQLPGETTFKCTAKCSSLAAVLEDIDAGSLAAGLATTVRGSAGVGVLYIGTPVGASHEALGVLLERLRETCSAAGGSAVVLRAPAAAKAALDVWGPVAGLELMRRVKDRFDPAKRLAPSRFVGGI